MVFNGNTASSAASPVKNIPFKIISFSIANKTGGSITVNAGLLFGSTITNILNGQSLSSGESFIYSGKPIIVLPNYQIYISASGSTDYYFSCE